MSHKRSLLLDCEVSRLDEVVATFGTEVLRSLMKSAFANESNSSVFLPVPGMEMNAQTLVHNLVSS